MSPSSDAGCGTTSEREAGTTSGLSKLPIEPTLQRTVQRTSALDVVSRRLHSHNRRQLAVQSTLEIDTMCQFQKTAARCQKCTAVQLRVLEHTSGLIQ